MNTNPESLLWLATAAIASVGLLAMMRRRQTELSVILHEYVQEKLAWAKKKARAAHLAKTAALKKAQQEQAAADRTAAELARHAAELAAAEEFLATQPASEPRKTHR